MIGSKSATEIGAPVLRFAADTDGVAHHLYNNLVLLRFEA